jgi:hypothetical protein
MVNHQVEAGLIGLRFNPLSGMARDGIESLWFKLHYVGQVVPGLNFADDSLRMILCG